mmetsp:Transcript_30137/g.49809  ORF Transcript_30137/g.49809 Transcript_30137/m.49809 type:complete len:431 (+) Transcript_30137:808-2100(+)
MILTWSQESLYKMFPLNKSWWLKTTVRRYSAARPPSPPPPSPARAIPPAGAVPAAALEEVGLVVLLALAVFVVVLKLLLVQLLDLLEVDPPPQDAPDPAEPPAELAALLGPVCDEFQVCTEVLVIIREPLHQGHLLHDLQLDARGLVAEVRVVLLLGLLGREVQHARLARLRVLHREPQQLEVVPDHQRLHGAQVQRLQRVLHHEAVLARVLGDLLEVLLQQLLLLHQLHVAQRLAAQLDGLVEPRLPAVRDVHRLDHRPGQPRVEQVRVGQLGLEVRRAGQHQPGHVAPVVRDEELHRHLSHLADVVVALLQPQAREPQRGLAPAAVLLGQVHRELVQHLARVPREGAVERAVAVHHDEPELVVVLQQLVQRLRVELVVAQVQRGVDRPEGLEVVDHALLLALVGHHRAAVDHQPVWRNSVIQLEPLLG